MTISSTSSVTHHRRDAVPVGSRRATRGRREHPAAPIGADRKSYGRLHANLLDRQLFLCGGDLQTETTLGLLHVQHLHTDLSDRHHVLGVVLDQTRGGTGSCRPRCNLAAHTVHADSKVTVITTASVLSKSGRRFHVGLYDVGILG
jgi:hypothetical protein